MSLVLRTAGSAGPVNLRVQRLDEDCDGRTYYDDARN